MRQFFTRLFFFLLVAGVASPALAQLGPGLTPPPVFQTIDSNGVELQSGRLVRVLASISIGPDGPGGLRFDWSTDSAAQAAIWGYVTLQQSPQDPSKDIASVTIGGSTETFTSPHGAYVFTQDQGRPSTLTYNAGTTTYTYTETDGSVAVFTGITSIGVPIVSLTYPAGQVLQYYWGTDVAPNGVVYSNVHAVTSNLGYQLRLTWSGNQVISAVVFNMNSEACDPAAPSCTLTGTWPTLTWDSVNKRVADNTGKWVGFNTSSGWVISYPSGRTLTYNNNVFSDGKGSWTYQHPYPFGWTTIVFNPENGSNPRIVTWTQTGPGTIGPVATDAPVSGQYPSLSYAYDSKSRLTSFKKLGNSVTSETRYAYDARGNLNQVRQVSTTPGTPADIIQGAVFPSTCTNVKTCNEPTSITDARGNTTDYTYDPNSGEVATVTRPAPTAGAVRPQVRYTYTQMSALYKNGSGTIVSGSPVWMLTGISQCQTQSSCAGTTDEVKTTIAYDVKHGLMPISISKSDGTGALSATTTMTYTGLADVNTVDGPLPGTADTTRNYYDIMGRPLGSIGPDPDGAGPLKMRAARISYDSDGRPSTREIGTATGQGDNDLANMTSLQQQVTSYDAQSRVATVKANAGGTTYSLLQASYSNAGAPDCRTLRMNPAIFGSPPADACALGTQGSYGPDRITKYAHDVFFRTTSATSGYGTSDAAVEVTNTYDSLGRLSTAKDAENNLTTYEYDGMNRLSKTRYPVPTKGGNASSATDYEQPTYDPNGNVTQQRARSGATIGYTFDALNRLTHKGGSAIADRDFTYDNLDRMLTAKFSTGGQGITNIYDALSRLSSTSSDLGGTAHALIYQFDLAGNRTQMNWWDGFYVNYDRLVTGEISKVRENGATTGVGVLTTYGYDDLGNRTGVTFGNGASQAFGYDPVSRLTSLTNDLSGTTNDLSVTLGYNPASQITQTVRSGDAYAFTATANGTTAYSSNGLNQQVSIGGSTASWDANGNLSTEPQSGKTYTYNVQDQLTASSGGAATSLAYDPLDRLDTYNPGALRRFIYDGSEAAAEIDSTGAIQNRYVRGDEADELLVDYSGSGTTSRRFTSVDERGSIISLTDSSGNLVGIDRYDEYGKPQTSNIGRFQYTGQAWLPEANVAYYKARTYLPHLGIFGETDPATLTGSTNLYAYVGNDPVNETDPLGMQECFSGRTDATCSTGCNSSPISGACDPIDVIKRLDDQQTNCESSICAIVTPDPIGFEPSHNETASIWDLVKRLGPLKLLEVFESTPAGETPEALAAFHHPRLNRHSRKTFAKFGWTEPDIERIYKGGPTGTSTNRFGDHLVAYGTPDEYILVNTITDEIIALSHKGEPSFIPDDKIQWFK